MKALVYVALALGLLVFGGCDLFASGLEGIVVEASGRVVLAETGEPIAGLGVAIKEVPASFTATVTVATTETDAEGQFTIRYETSRVRTGHSDVSYEVAVNSVPYDSRYTSFGDYYHPPPDVHLNFGVIELEENESP